MYLRAPAPRRARAGNEDLLSKTVAANGLNSRSQRRQRPACRPNVSLGKGRAIEDAGRPGAVSPMDWVVPRRRRPCYRCEADRALWVRLETTRSPGVSDLVNPPSCHGL